MKTKKKQVMELWKTAFGDSNKFMKLYFNRVYRDENALVIEKDGRVLSSLQMLPYTMSYFGEEIPVAYISGASTQPAEEGKGLMKELLRRAFEEMKRRRIAVTVLIPAEKWLFGFYRSQGYTEVFEYALKVYTRHEYIEPEQDLKVAVQDEKVGDDVYAFFDRKLRERPLSILHSGEDLEIIIRDGALLKGKVFVARNLDGKPVGMAFACHPEKEDDPGSTLIKEILYDDERILRHLLFHITTYFKVLKAVYRLPFKDNLITFSYGMARVIDTGRLIQIWAKNHPGATISSAEMEKMDINTLTSHLFDYSHKAAYMSLMLD